MGAVLLACDHAGEFEAVPYQIPQLVDVRRGDKRRLDHAAHIQVADPLCVLAVSLVALHGFCVLRMGKSDPQVILFQDIENRDPILAGGFHTDIRTIVFSKPIAQFLQPFCEGRETSLLVLGTVVGIGNANTGKDPCFVDVKPTAVFLDDFEQFNNLLKDIDIRMTGTCHPAKSSRLWKR